MIKFKKEYVATAIGILGIAYWLRCRKSAVGGASEEDTSGGGGGIGGGGFFGGFMPSTTTASTTTTTTKTSGIESGITTQQRYASTPVSASATQKAETLAKPLNVQMIPSGSSTSTSGTVGTLPKGAIDTGTQINLPSAPTSQLPTGGTALIPKKITSPLATKGGYDSSGINPSAMFPFSGKGLTLDNLFH